MWNSEFQGQERSKVTSSELLLTAKSLQSCPTLCDPTNGSLTGSPVPGILQARILEWVAISCSNAWKWKVKVKSLSRVWLLVTPWTTAHQAPPSMGFSRQEYWSGVPKLNNIKTSNFQKAFSKQSSQKICGWTKLKNFHIDSSWFTSINYLGLPDYELIH